MIVPILPPEEIKLPALACPIIGGMRVSVGGGFVRDHNGASIPSRYVQKLFSMHDGMEGRLTLRQDVPLSRYWQIADEIMSPTGEPDVVFYVFDCATVGHLPLWQRLGIVYEQTYGRHRISPALHMAVNNATQLRNLDEFWKAQGWEGAFARDPNEVR